jgi:hypothetical protein
MLRGDATKFYGDTCWSDRRSCLRVLQVAMSCAHYDSTFSTVKGRDVLTMAGTAVPVLVCYSYRLNDRKENILRLFRLMTKRTSLLSALELC